MSGAYCEWWNKPLLEVTEREQEVCSKHGWNCQNCPYFGEDE